MKAVRPWMISFFFQKFKIFNKKKQKLNIYISKELIEKVFSGEPYLTFP